MKFSQEQVDDTIIPKMEVGKEMTKPTLAEDIGIAISCVQDYLDTIDSYEEQEHYDRIRLTIERLMRFYYQLIGFDIESIIRKTRNTNSKFDDFKKQLSEIVNEDYIESWLQKPNAALNSRKPIDLINEDNYGPLYSMIYKLGSGEPSS